MSCPCLSSRASLVAETAGGGDGGVPLVLRTGAAGVFGLDRTGQFSAAKLSSLK